MLCRGRRVGCLRVLHKVCLCASDVLEGKRQSGPPRPRQSAQCRCVIQQFAFSSRPLGIARAHSATWPIVLRTYALELEGIRSTSHEKTPPNPSGLAPVSTAQDATDPQQLVSPASRPACKKSIEESRTQASCGRESRNYSKRQMVRTESRRARAMAGKARGMNGGRDQ